MSQQGREVVIVEAVRTPIGRGHPRRATTRTPTRTSCSGRPTREVIARAGIDPPRSRTSSPAACSSSASRAFNVARNAWLQAGLPIETPATTIDRQCGSAQQAVNFGASLIAAGIHDVVIGSGVEHMGHVPFVGRHGDPAEVRRAFTAEADGAAQHRRPGPGRRDDRRRVGDPALRARRARACARTGSPRRRPRRAASSARSCRSQVNGDTLRHRPGHPPRHDARGAGRSSSRRSSPTARSPRATRRRSPTAPPRCC